MEALFKKYFWVVNLAVLAVVAWFCARTIVDIVATKYLTVAPEPVTVAANGNSAPLFQKAEDQNLGEVLVERSPFNVEEKKVEKPAEECKANCEGKACGDDGCSGSCGACGEEQTCTPEGKCEDKDEEPAQSELNIQLVGTTVNPTDPSFCFATILLDGATTDVVTVGSDIQDGKAKVIDIQPMMLYLREGNKLTHVGLWSEAAGPKAPPGPQGRIRPGMPMGDRPPPNAGVQPPPMPAMPQGANFDYASGVKKNSEYDYTIDKQMLDQQLTDLTQLGMQARVIPNYRQGKYEGFKLVGVRPGSLYRAIGIRSGDVVRSINGGAINSPNKAMELFTQLKNSSAITLEVERRGKIETFNYKIQ